MRTINLSWKTVPVVILGCALSYAQTFEINGQNTNKPAGQRTPSAKPSTGTSSGLSWGASIDIERQSRAAENALKRGDFASAANFAEHAANAAPQDTRLWFLLGYSARLAGRYPLSISAYERGLKSQPSSAEGLSGLAQTYARIGKFDEAKRLLNQLLTLNPRAADDLLFAGELFLQSGDVSSALNFLNRSEQVRPSARAEILLAGAYSRLKDNAKAKRYLEMAQRRDPNNPEMLRALASFYRENKQYPEAITLLKRLAGKNPDIMAELAYTYELGKDRKNSADAYARAAEAAPKQIGYQLSAAQAQVALDNVKAAQPFLQRAEGLDAEHYRLHAIRAEIARMENRSQDALQEYNRALASVPDGVPEGPLYPIQLRMNASELYRDTGDEGAAQQNANLASQKIAAVQVEPALQTEFLRLRASIRASLNDLNGAEADMKEALALEPQNANTLLQYGSLMWKMKRPQEAERLFTQTLAADPSNRYALTSLGYLSREMNNNVKAEGYFLKLAKFYPNEFGSYLSLGDLYTTMRKFDLAETNYQVAYKLNRSNPMIVAGGANAGIEDHRLDRTGVWLKRAVGNMNDHPYVMRERERYLTWTGNYRDAAKLGYKVVEKLPNDRDAVVYLGYSLLYLGRYDDLLRLTTKYEPILNRDAALPLLAGYVHRNADLLDQAVDAFTRAIERDDHVTTAYVNRGYALNDMQNPEMAAKDFEYALKLEPNDGEAHLGAAFSYLQLKKPALVLEHADRAAKLMGESKVTHMARAGGYRGKMQLAKAEGEYREAAKLDPNDLEPKMGLAQTLFAARRYPEAIRAYQDVLPLVDDPSELYGEMASASARLHRSEDARRYVAAAERGASDNAGVLMATGDTLLILGDNAGAMSRFERALSAPDSTRVDVRLAFARTFLSQGKFEDARQQVALAFAESRVGEGAPITAENLTTAAGIFEGMNDFDLATRYYGLARDAGAEPKSVAIGLANTYLAQGKFNDARAELNTVGTLADNSSDYDYVLAYGNMNRQERKNTEAMLSFARAHELALYDDSAQRSLHEVAAEEGIRINQRVSMSNGASVTPIFEDATVYQLDAAILGITNTSLLPVPRHSIETGFTSSYKVHFANAPPLLASYQLRNTRGQTSFPSQSEIVRQNSYDTIFNFSTNPAVRFGQTFLYLTPGVEFNIRRDTLSPTVLNQNLFRQFLYLSTSPLFNWVTVSANGMHETGPFTENFEKGHELSANLDFRVGRPWGRNALLTGYHVRDLQLDPLIREFFTTSSYLGFQHRFRKNLKTAVLGEYIRSWRVQDSKFAIAQAMRPAFQLEYQPNTRWGFNGTLAMTRGEGFHTYDNLQSGFLISYTKPLRRNYRDGLGEVAVEYPLKLSFGIEQQTFTNFTGTSRGTFLPVIHLNIF